MNRRRSSGRFTAIVVASALLAGCTGAAGSTPSPASTPTPGIATPAPGGSGAAGSSASGVQPTASPVVETYDVVYATESPWDKLDVYSPAEAGTWPVAVLFHGSPPTNDKITWRSVGWELASLGFVAFVPSWGHDPNGSLSGAPTYDQLGIGLSQAACAVAFAATHAPEYGGDASKVIVFGHSAGANIAAMMAFARPDPAAGCLGGTTPGAVDAAVTWDGDWMLMDPIWDTATAGDERLFDRYSPLDYVADHKDLRVTMLASEDPAPYARDLRATADASAFFAVRDPTGTYRDRLEANGALSDGSYDLREMQEFFFEVLQAQGSPVSLDILPHATHDALGAEGRDVLVGAIRRTAADL